MSSADQDRLQAEVERLRSRVASLEGQLEAAQADLQRLTFLEARRASHLANTPLAVILWDTDFRVVEWNPAAERIFGYSAEQAMGQYGCDLLVPAEVRPHVEQIFRGLLDQTGGSRSTNENVTRDGRRILCEWYSTPVVNDRGVVVGAVSLAQDVTEQQAVSDRLRDREVLLGTIVDHAPDLIVLTDRDGRITYVNRLTGGYTLEQVQGRAVQDFVPAEHRAIVENAVAAAIATGELQEYEVQDAANRRWYSTRLAPVMQQGEAVGMVAICVDMDDRRRQQEALRESEQRYRVLAENVPGFVYTCRGDADFSTTAITDAVERITGVSAREFVGNRSRWLQLIHRDDIRPVRDRIEQALRERRRYRLVYRIRRADGRWIWLEDYGQGVFDEQGELRFITGMAFDVTGEREAEQTARRREEMFRVLAANVPGVVYLCANDEQYSMYYLNDAVEQLTGVAAQQFLDGAVSFVELYHPDDAAVIPAAVDAAVAVKAPFHLVYRLRHADGRWVWVEEYGQGIFDDETGELRYLEGAIFDVTAKREAEESLRRSKAELELAVEDRTQELRMANRLLREDYKQQVSLTRKLRESEERFRVMCEANPGAVAISRLSDGSITYAKQRLAVMLGVERSALEGRPSVDFYVDPLQRESLLAALKSQRFTRDFELRLRRADGAVIWTSASMQCIDLQGETFILTIFLDISERIQYAEQLNSERRMLRRLLFLHERDRQLIAYEIHDGIVQDMTGAVMHLQGAVGRLERKPASAAEDLNQAVQILRDSIDEARRLIDGLRPGVLEEQGVVAAVEYLCEQADKLHGVKVEFTSDVRFDRLAPAVEIAIYRIVQEGLSNIVRHSQSAKAAVELSQRASSLVIKVRDWGVGFAVEKVKPRRYGLTGVRDRAKLLGGTARIESEPGQGTRVRVELPLADILLPGVWRQPEISPLDEDSSSGDVPPA
ncbi:MAG: PAS domain S-box protein [Planctomycetales bacterium]|nr:PAS domain S-box protein [Planctomycetales bacterium]